MSSLTPTLFGADGMPVRASATEDADTRQRVDLSAHEADVIIRYTKMLAARNLRPELVCRHCTEVFTKTEDWKCSVEFSAVGDVLVQCGCTVAFYEARRR